MKHLLLEQEDRAKRIRDLAYLIDPDAFLHARRSRTDKALRAAAHIASGHPVCRHADGRIEPVLDDEPDLTPLYQVTLS